MMVVRYMFICLLLLLAVYETASFSDTACYGSHTCDLYSLQCPAGEIINLNKLYVGRKNDSTCLSNDQHCDDAERCCSLSDSDIDLEDFNIQNTFHTYTNCSARNFCTHQSPWQRITSLPDAFSSYVHLEYECLNRTDILNFCGADHGPSTKTGRYVEVLFDGSRESFDPTKASKECECTVSNQLSISQTVVTQLKDFRLFSYSKSGDWWQCSSAIFTAPGYTRRCDNGSSTTEDHIEENFLYQYPLSFTLGSGSSSAINLRDIHLNGLQDSPASVWVMIEGDTGDVEVSCREIIPADFTTTTTTTTTPSTTSSTTTSTTTQTTTTSTTTTPTTTTTTTPTPTTTSTTTTITTTTPGPTTKTTTPRPTTTTTTPTTTTTTTTKTTTTTTTPRSTTTTTKPTTTTTTTRPTTTTTTPTTTTTTPTTTTTTPRPATTTTTPTTTTTTTRPTTTTTTPTTTTTTPVTTKATTTPRPTTTTTTTTARPTTTSTPRATSTTSTTTPRPTTRVVTPGPTTTTTTTPRPTTRVVTPGPTTTTTTTPRPVTPVPGSRMGDGIDDEKQDGQVYMAIFIPIALFVVGLTAFFLWVFVRTNGKRKSKMKIVRPGDRIGSPLYNKFKNVNIVYDDSVPISEIDPNSPVVLGVRDSPVPARPAVARVYVNNAYHIPSLNDSPRDPDRFNL